ncbi:MAG TPA: hypothetical protein VD999_04255 [Vitreimonas sp.]|nr:hypothetical protein [Vitreimonas sp.]
MCKVERVRQELLQRLDAGQSPARLHEWLAEEFNAAAFEDDDPIDWEAYDALFMMCPLPPTRSQLELETVLDETPFTR